MKKKYTILKMRRKVHIELYTFFQFQRKEEDKEKDSLGVFFEINYQIYPLFTIMNDLKTLNINLILTYFHKIVEDN